VAEEFYSFDKALRELKLRSEELKKLVSQGEIRAFRDKDTMKFKKEDVEILAKRRTATGGDDVVEELVFADEETDDTGMATAQISEEDTLLVEDVEEPVVVEPAPRARPVVQKPVRAARVVNVIPVDKKEGTLMLVCAILTSVLLFYGVFVIQSVTAQKSTGLTQWLTNMFAPK
jgi:hypothetical protein